MCIVARVGGPNNFRWLCLLWLYGASLVFGASEDQAQQAADDFYRTEVDPGVQKECLSCHLSGGVAQLSGARFSLSRSVEQNLSSFKQLLLEVDPAWILSKASGDLSHGGGPIAAVGSSLYEALSHYLALITGGDAPLEDAEENFWEGTALESRETTIRRASLLFAGKVASDRAINAAKESPTELRQQILATMEGDGFKDFLLSGANDRLLTDGLMNGLDFFISTKDRYPQLSEFLQTLPEERPEKYQNYHDKPFLTRNDAEWAFRWAVHREPLELIAHVVMNDKPYSEVLTADYTMVNQFSNIAYRSELTFDAEFADEDGFHDRSQFSRFLPGSNTGHIPHDESFEFDNDNETVLSFSGYQAIPHAGVLSTQAWLARYPTTDTNRNRARARWTYFYFLGVDIEKSAPRTTDPVALADTDNPTLKNAACTVCHERLDPVAGAYQSYGNNGHYLDQFGGMDSLSDSYKCPECYGGEHGSTGYQYGDTWYRDMRDPGFEGDEPAMEVDSLQWLADSIVEDPRFAVATVRFWWPAVFGSEPLGPPQDTTRVNFDQEVRAYNAQEALISSLASDFVKNDLNLKALLTDMAMSKWFRTSEFKTEGLSDEVRERREAELLSVGSGRLLTPEELDRKNMAVFGRTWQQWRDGHNPHSFDFESAFRGQWAPYRTFYGGIDAAVVTARNRTFTPLMANLTQSMAADLSCQVVLSEFAKATRDRHAFEQVEKHTYPGQLVDEAFSLSGTVISDQDWRAHKATVSATSVGGQALIRIRDITRDSYASTDGKHTNADLIVREIVFRQGGSIVKRINGKDFPALTGFRSDTWIDDSGRSHLRGDVRQEAGGWWMHENAWIEIQVDLAEGEYDVELALATSLKNNNVNESMLAKISIEALDNWSQTDSSIAIKNQVRSLILRATNRGPVDGELGRALKALAAEAANAREEGDWFFSGESGGRCDTHSIWGSDDLSESEQYHRYGDPDGMLRAWTMFTHSLLTSFWYLHD